MEMLNEMAVFAQVVDSEGFSAAARQLKLTTSAVSRHVTRLETQLGGRLLTRTTRSLKLAELGAEVYAGCSRLLSEAREIHHLAGSYAAKPSGLIRISAPVVLGQVWLAPCLPGFLARYPEVSLHVSLLDRQVDLVGDGIDVAIRIARELQDGLVSRPLFAMRYVLVASPAYLARRGTPSSPQDLFAHDCLHLGYGVFGSTWTLTQAGQAVQIKVPSRASVNNSAAMLAMVEADGGIGLMPDFSVRAALAARQVLPVLPDWRLGEPYTGHVHAVYTPGPHLPLKTRVLIDHLAARNPPLSR